MSAEKNERDGPSGAGPETTGSMPLAQARGGQEVVLVRAAGGRTFRHRLAEIGLSPGVRFRVLSRGQAGPFLVSLREGRFMLGQGMVQRMFVRPV